MQVLFHKPCTQYLSAASLPHIIYLHAGSDETAREKLPESVSHTLQPNISSVENQPLQYEVAVPQQRNVYSTLESSDNMYETGKTRVSESV